MVFMRLLRRVHISMHRAIPAWEDALRELNERNVYVAVVSNKTSVLLREEVAHLGGRLFCVSGRSGDPRKINPPRRFSWLCKGLA
jgi:phosphoglycolate phosphatase-like HAD superfamily hydrolase